MSILRKQNAEVDILEIHFMLMYHLGWDRATIHEFIETFEVKKSGMKNFWLQKKESKDQAKEHNAKLDEIARFVTKYITNRKSSKR